MRNIVIFMAGAAFAISPALAQTTTPAAPATGTTTAPSTSTDVAPAPSNSAPGAVTTAPPTTATPAPAGTATAPAAAETAAATPAKTDPTVGDTVNDPQGAKVGTVTATNGNLVTVATASTKAQLPKTAFARNDTGLVIGMTAAQLDAAAKAAGGKGAGN